MTEQNIDCKPFNNSDSNTIFSFRKDLVGKWWA